MDEKMPGDRFIETLRGLRDGKTLTELEEAMNELVEAVRDTGRKGSVTLKIDLTCVTDGIYETSDNITLKAPWHALSNTLFFGTPDGNLVRHDPRQQDLLLARDIADAPTPSAPAPSLPDHQQEAAPGKCHASERFDPFPRHWY